jgi:hypothetical protein
LPLAAVLAAAQPETLSGKWKVHNSAAGNESTQDCTFTQAESEMKGSCITSQGTTVQIAGKIDGKAVDWTYKSEYNGSPLTVVYKGKIQDSGKITGSVTAVEFGVEGEFTATLEK